MNRRKFLIISRLILPAQNPRAFRATELAKELARQGHIVKLYAVLGNFDYSIFENEYNIKVVNIGKMRFATYNSDENIRNNFFDKILNKLLKRLIEYPDIELMFKVPKIIFAEENTDILISIAAPFTIHWGCALSKQINKKKFPATWAADCGDPYMGNNALGQKRKLFYFKYIEKWFCGKADFIVVPFEGAIGGYYPEFREKIVVIPQGFQLNEAKLCNNKPKYRVPTFAYSGVFYALIRNPTVFLEYLTTLEIGFKFVVYTRNTDFLNPYLDKLGDKLDIRDYIPRDQLLFELSKMDFLVNFENTASVHSPSKLIDYAIVKRPILNIPADELPVDTIKQFLDGNYHDQYIVRNIEQYDISNVAKKFIKLHKKEHNNNRI